MDMTVSKLQELVMDREAWHAVVHRVAKSQTFGESGVPTEGMEALSSHISCPLYLFHLAVSELCL